MPAAKKSYVISCSSAFRDRVQALADARDVNVGDLARSVMLVVPPEAIAATEDPGEPAAADYLRVAPVSAGVGRFHEKRWNHQHAAGGTAAMAVATARPLPSNRAGTRASLGGGNRACRSGCRRDRMWSPCGVR